MQALIAREELDALLAMGVGLDLIELTNAELAELISAAWPTCLCWKRMPIQSPKLTPPPIGRSCSTV